MKTRDPYYDNPVYLALIDCSIPDSICRLCADHLAKPAQSLVWKERNLLRNTAAMCINHGYQVPSFLAGYQ